MLEQLKFRPDEFENLRNACLVSDRVARFHQELDGKPLTVPGSKGQPVINPLLVELRANEEHLSRLLRALNVPDEPLSVSANERSTAARALALRRWYG